MAPARFIKVTNESNQISRESPVKFLIYVENSFFIIGWIYKIKTSRQLPGRFTIELFYVFINQCIHRRKSVDVTFWLVVWIYVLTFILLFCNSKVGIISEVD